MMWNALIHSYMVANPRDQTLHMGNRGIRRDAVAEVENERLWSERFEDGIGRTIECGSAGEQRQRIEIALNGAQRLNLIARKAQLRHPIEPYRVDRYRFEVTQQFRSCAARKADDARRRKLFAHVRYDPRCRFDAPLTKFIARQYACPGIEDLHGIDTGRKLFDQVARRSLD